MTYPVRVSEVQYYGYGDDHTVNLPSGVSGQTILLFIGSNGNPTMSTAPSGFTLVNSWTSGTTAKVFLYYRVTDGNEGSTVSFTLSADHDVRCRLERFRNLRSGAVADWLDVASEYGSDSSPSLDTHYPTGFDDDEYFCHFGYAFVVGDGTLDSYPDYLTQYRDADKSTGTDDDVQDTVAARISTFNEFPSSSWDFQDVTTNAWVALAVSLRGDTLEIVGQDYSTEYGVGGWVRSDAYSVLWEYPEQPTATLQVAYTVFVFTDALTTTYEDTFTGAAGSIYDHTPDSGTDYGYGFGAPNEDPSPPRLTGDGWLAPYSGGGPVYLTQSLSVSEDSYAFEWVVKFQGEGGYQYGQTCEVLLVGSGNTSVRTYLYLYDGSFDIYATVTTDTGYDDFVLSYVDATPEVGNTYTIRVEIANSSLVGVYLNSALKKVLNPGGTIPTPNALHIYQSEGDETSGTPNFILSHVKFQEAASSGSVLSDLDVVYDAIAAVGASLSPVWNFPEQATKTYTVGYHLLLGVSSDLTTQFKVGFDPVGQNKSVDYDILTIVGKSVSTAYDIESRLPSIAARGYISFGSGSTPVDVQIPLPAGRRVGDVVFVTYAGGSYGLKSVFDPGRGQVVDLELDGQHISRFYIATGEDGWYHRITGSESSSYLVVPAEHQYDNRTYRFFVFVLRNIFPYTPGPADFHTWVDVFSQSSYGSGSPVLFELPNAYLWHSGYTEDNWKINNYTLQVALLHGRSDTTPDLSESTIGYPDQFVRDYGVFDCSAIASTVTLDYPPTYYASFLPLPGFPNNPNARYFEAPEFVNSSQDTYLFVFRGVASLRKDWTASYDVYNYVHSDLFAEWAGNPLHKVGFDVHYGMRPQQEFVVDYRIDEKSITGFDISYALSPTLRVGFEVSFAGAVSSDSEIGSWLGYKPSMGFDATHALGSAIAVGFEVSYSDLAISAFETGSSLHFARQLAFDANHSLYANVQEPFDVSYYSIAGAEFDVASGLWSTSSAAFSASHALVQNLVSAFDVHWSLKSISMAFDISSSLITQVRNSVNVVSALITKIVEDVDIGFFINNIDRISNDFSFGYFYSSSSVVLTPTNPLVVLDGRTLDIFSAEVAADEDGDVWEASFALSNLADFSLFSVNKEFSLFFCGEEYRLIVDSRAIDRSNPEDVTATIYGVSPAKQYQTPRAALVSKTWTAPTLASSIATELIPALQWQTIDWVVDGGAYGVEEASPLDGVKTLAAVVGAIFESLPDGTMRVRPKYPVSVPNFSVATASFTITDLVDNFSYSEKYTPNKLENLITITDEEEGKQDRVEFIVDEYLSDRGVIRVYPAVWRETVSIRPTGDILSYVYDGVVVREEEEEVEFVNGAASTSYPIVDIVSVVWNTTNLGSVGFEFYKQELTCSVANDAYSLLKIKYLTQSHNFNIVGTYNTSVQFVVENV